MDYRDYLKESNFIDSISNADVEFEACYLITEARMYAGLTQAQLAKKINTKQPSIARAENGTVIPSISFLNKIAKATGTRLIAPRFEFMNSRFGFQIINAPSLSFESPRAKGNLQRIDGGLVSNSGSSNRCVISVV